MKSFCTHVLTLGVVFAIGGCKGDDPKPDKLPTATLTAKEAFLTAKKWRISGVLVTRTINGQTETVDAFYAYNPCTKDNFFTYKADKSVTADAGADRCYPGELQVVNGTWAFNAAETELTLIYPDNTTTTEVLHLDATTLRVRNPSSVGSPTVLTTTFTAF